jgi:hypothetical protein
MCLTQVSIKWMMRARTGYFTPDVYGRISAIKTIDKKFRDSRHFAENQISGILSVVLIRGQAGHCLLRSVHAEELVACVLALASERASVFESCWRQSESLELWVGAVRARRAIAWE